MQNLDPQEIRKFEALASRWWDPNSEFRPLHEINPLRMNYIAGLMNPADKKALDVGCGGGILTETLCHYGAEVTGIDMADAALAVARLHLRDSGLEIDYRKSTPEQLAGEQPEEYELLTCMEMLEHVPDPASVVAACRRLLKPGGLAIFSTINRNPKSWLFAIVGAEYILRLLPRGTHEYAKLIKPSELAGWCRAAGLDLEAQIGMGYNPITKKYFLQPSLDVNYIACFRKPPAQDTHGVSPKPMNAGTEEPPEGMRSG